MTIVSVHCFAPRKIRLFGVESFVPIGCFDNNTVSHLSRTLYAAGRAVDAGYNAG